MRRQRMKMTMSEETENDFEPEQSNEIENKYGFGRLFIIQITWFQRTRLPSEEWKKQTNEHLLRAIKKASEMASVFILSRFSIRLSFAVFSLVVAYPFVDREKMSAAIEFI